MERWGLFGFGSLELVGVGRVGRGLGDLGISVLGLIDDARVVGRIFNMPLPEPR